MIQFTVYGSPVAQPRTRARAMASKAGRIFAHVYEPKDSPARQWKADIKQEAIKFKPAAPWDGPIVFRIDFFLPRPARLMRAKDPDGAIYHTKKPDRDNLEKAALDALKGIFFVDDCQVCCGEIRKYYHSKTTGPRAEIQIGPL